MSNQHDDSNLEPIRPQSKTMKMPVQRIISAGPVLENVVNQTLPNTAADGEISKLRISATPFVPKNRRTDGTLTTNKPASETTQVENKESLNNTLSSTATNVSGTSIPLGGTVQTPGSNYPSKSGNYTQPTYIPYTYLNTPAGMYPSHVQPHINMFPPNKGGNQIYPGFAGMQSHPGMSMGPSIPFGQYPMYASQPKYTPMGAMPITTPTSTTITSTTVMSSATNYATVDSKKSSFNKNAQPFYPKSFKHDSTTNVITPLETEKAETKTEFKVEPSKVEVKVQPNPEKQEKVEISEKDEINQESIREAESNVEVEAKIEEKVEVPLNEETRQDKKTEEELKETKPQIINAFPVTEQAKPEKKTKLDNLFDSSSSGPVSKPKAQIKESKKADKSLGVLPTTSKSKHMDKNKYFEEMSKKLQTEKQKLFDVKPKPNTQKRETIEKENPIEEIETKEEEYMQKEQQEVVALEESKPDEDEIKKETVEETADIVEESPQEQNMKQTIERDYFLVNESSDKEADTRKVKHIYSVEYILSFKEWKICKEDKLLTDMLKDHIKIMSTVHEEERPKAYKGHSKRESKPINIRQSSDMTGSFHRKPEKEKEEIKRQSSTTTTSTEGLQRWGRKDMSEAEKSAQEFKLKLDEERKRDPVRNDLTELLNILTVDNYDEVKKQIFDKIKGDVEDQGKFLEVLFKKAVHEKAFVVLYSRLCKDLDKELPQKSEKVAEKTVGGKLAVRPSIMRSKLLEKCKEIFKTDQDSKVDQYIKVSDPEEREAKMKKFLLGNVNFIGELINTKILSKKIVFQCLNNLFSRVEKADELNVFFKQINIEAIVILMDKFGTLINKYDTKTKPEELLEFTKKIDDYLSRLESIERNDKSIPGHIRYKIINLIEKKNRGWEESKVDKTVSAQGKNQIKEELESEMRGSISGKSGAKLDQETVNNKIREDLYAWREHMKSGYSAHDYHWDITETLVKKHKNTIGEILNAFGENCIDFINKKDDINYAYLYIREIISYFFKKLTQNEKNEINQVALYWLENIGDFSLDNINLIDVWGGTIYLLDYYNIFTYQDIDKLTDLSNEQLKGIFGVINASLGYHEDRQKKKNDLLNIPLVLANKSLFLNCVKDS